MKMHILNFEAAGEHVEVADLSVELPEGKYYVTKESAAAAVNLCAVYKAVRPFLTVVTALPFVPAGAKQKIKELMTALDAFCP